MNDDKEDTHVPDEMVPVTTALVTTTPPTMMSMQDTATHETWSLTPGLWRESQYEYELVREMGPHPRCREKEMGWEDHLTYLEGLQDQLVQAVEEAVLEIPAMLA
ncbi:UNVERIFIED_CONTAM: hypothetical protein K2H54_033236 [Gekko kuhli]